MQVQDIIKNIEGQLKAAVLADANRPAEVQEIWHRAVNVVMYNNRLCGDDIYIEIMDLINQKKIELPSQEELAAADKLHAEEKAQKKARYLERVEEAKRREAEAAAEVEPWGDAEAYEYV